MRDYRHIPVPEELLQCRFWRDNTPVSKFVQLTINGTSSVPTRFSMKAEHMLSPSYAERSRLMGMRHADGSEIKGHEKKYRKLSLEYK